MARIKFPQIILALLATLVAIFLSNCSWNEKEFTQKAEIDEGNHFRVAIVLPGKTNDGSWSQLGYEGLKLIENRYKATVKYADNVAEKDALQVGRNLARQDFDFIIWHGGEYTATAEAIALEFPRTKFALNAANNGNNRNLGTFRSRAVESGYLSGFAAGLKTKTNRIVHITGFPYPANLEETGFIEVGARAANPKAEVKVEFSYSWTDVDKATKIALKYIADGFDVVSVNLDHNEDVIKTIAKQPNVYAIGWGKDQSHIAPDRVITSVIYDTPKMMATTANLVQSGRWEGKIYKFGIKEKALRIAPFRGLLDSEQETKFNNVRNDILAGKIDSLESDSKMGKS
jgi:basic membrane protein A and related proteins